MPFSDCGGGRRVAEASATTSPLISPTFVAFFERGLRIRLSSELSSHTVSSIFVPAVNPWSSTSRVAAMSAVLPSSLKFTVFPMASARLAVRGYLGVPVDVHVRSSDGQHEDLRLLLVEHGADDLR